jgi:hypothetical protein
MPADHLSEIELEVMKTLAPVKRGGINIREADAKFGLSVMVGLTSKGFLSLLCPGVLIDDAYYCISPEGRESLSKHF